MNRQDQAWARLTAAARRAADDREVSAPYGFATRVAARAMSAPSLTGALLEKFALRGFVAAAACSVAAAAFGYSSLTSEQEFESTSGDLVVEVLAQS